MIKVDLSTAIAVYLVLWIMGFLAAWSILERRKIARSTAVDARYIWHCRICTQPYVDSLSGDISLCPVCQSYNEREVKG